MNDMLLNLIGSAEAKYPFVVLIFTAIGILRAINKPLFALLHSYAQASNSPKLEQSVDVVEQSSFYKGFLFVLDWAFSVKVIPQGPAVIVQPVVVQAVPVAVVSEQAPAAAPAPSDKQG